MKRDFSAVLARCLTSVVSLQKTSNFQFLIFADAGLFIASGPEFGKG